MSTFQAYQNQEYDEVRGEAIWVCTAVDPLNPCNTHFIGSAPDLELNCTADDLIRVMLERRWIEDKDDWTANGGETYAYLCMWGEPSPTFIWDWVYKKDQYADDPFGVDAFMLSTNISLAGEEEEPGQGHLIASWEVVLGQKGYYVTVGYDCGDDRYFSDIDDGPHGSVAAAVLAGAGAVKMLVVNNLMPSAWQDPRKWEWSEDIFDVTGVQLN